MILGVIGSRDWPNGLSHIVMREICDTQDSLAITGVATGDAHGVDEMARMHTENATSPQLPVTVYCANSRSPLLLRAKEQPTMTSYVLVSDWATDGHKAGRLRNRKLIAACDRVVAFTTGSPGTAHGIRLALEAKIPLKVVTIDRIARTYLPDGSTTEERL